MRHATRLAVCLTAFLFLLAACDAGLTDAPASIADGNVLESNHKVGVCHVTNCDPDDEECDEEEGELGNVNLIFVAPNAAVQHLDDTTSPHCHEGLCDYEPEGDVTAEDAAEDTDGNGVDEACESICPCFDLTDLQEGGPVAECGENFPGFPNLAGLVFEGGGGACSGELCTDFTPGVLSCLFEIQTDEVAVVDITSDEDQSCRNLILDPSVCPNPNAPVSAADTPSSTPFINR